MTAASGSSATGTELLPCPFCGQALRRKIGRINPMAKCVTEDCVVAAKMSVINLDDPLEVELWNTRVPQLVATAQPPTPWMPSIQRMPHAAQGSPDRGELFRLIDERLADLRKANDIFRGMTLDKSSDIQRNDREIRWLIDYRTVLLQPTQGGDKGEAELVSVYVEAWEKTVWVTPESAPDIIAILATPQPASNAYTAWQPIDTQPPAGTVIDVWMVLPSGHGARWTSVMWGDAAERWIGGPPSQDPQGWKATHWMRVPGSPSGSSTEGK